MTRSGKARTALVIGGGIAGPVAAMALRQAGIEAAVHEAYDSTADGAGGGMTIAPNGQNALDAIGAGDLVRAIGTPVTAMGLRSWTGKHLAQFAPPSASRPCSSSGAPISTGRSTTRRSAALSLSTTASG